MQTQIAISQSQPHQIRNASLLLSILSCVAVSSPFSTFSPFLTNSKPFLWNSLGRSQSLHSGQKAFPPDGLERSQFYNLSNRDKKPLLRMGWRDSNLSIFSIRDKKQDSLCSIVLIPLSYIYWLA